MTTTPRSSELRTRFATAQDFDALISQEVHVDVDRLRFLAFHGIPDETIELRASVWEILLPKLPSVSADAGTDVIPDSVLPTSLEITKLIREALDDYYSDESPFNNLDVREWMEKTCVNYYLEHPFGMASRDPKLLVYILGPFVYIYRDKPSHKEKLGHRDKVTRWSRSDKLFITFMSLLERYNKFQVKEKHFRRFMSLFRSQLPRLCAHFDDEELDPRKWVMIWHHSLFAKQLPLRCLLRLWDSYFSVTDDAFDLHIYVCLALLKMFENDLLDKTYPELRAFMQVLPVLDVERLVAQAQNFQCME